MRLSPFALLAGAAALTRAQSLNKEAMNSKKATTFNGVTVPPLLEITPSNFEDELKQTKYLMVKHYRYAQLSNSAKSPTDLLQSVLPALHRLRSDIPDPLRVLLHLASRFHCRYEFYRIL